MEASILTVAGALTQPSAYEPVHARVAPVGRTARTPAPPATPKPGSHRRRDDRTHIDPQTGAVTEANAVPEAILDFVYDTAAAGVAPLSP